MAHRVPLYLQTDFHVCASIRGTQWSPGFVFPINHLGECGGILNKLIFSASIEAHT